MTRHLVSTTVTTKPCPRCGRTVLAALDEGLPAEVDPARLDNTGEITALLDGRKTYTLTGGKELIHRDAGRIRHGHLRGSIHAEHQCKRGAK